MYSYNSTAELGVVWAVTSSMNHIGSVILSSSSALSTTFAKQDDSERGKKDREGEKDRPSTDPFVLQFSDAVDKIVLPALVQDMVKRRTSCFHIAIASDEMNVTNTFHRT